MRKEHEQLSLVPGRGGGLLGFPAISRKPGEQLRVVNNRDNTLGWEVFISQLYWEKNWTSCLPHPDLAASPEEGYEFPVSVSPELGCSGSFWWGITSRRMGCTAHVLLVGLKARGAAALISVPGRPNYSAPKNADGHCQVTLHK